MTSTRRMLTRAFSDIPGLATAESLGKCRIREGLGMSDFSIDDVMIQLLRVAGGGRIMVLRHLPTGMVVEAPIAQEPVTRVKNRLFDQLREAVDSRP